MAAGLEKKRVFYLDAVRALAAFLVVVNHTTGPYMLSVTDMSPNWWTALIDFFACKPAVPMFVMASGAVLLGKEDSYKKTALRIVRVLAVLLLASLFYYLVGPGSHDIAGFVFGLWTCSIKSHLWYLYMYLGLLVAMPIFQKLAGSMDRNDYLYFVAVSFVFSWTVPMLLAMTGVPSGSPWFQLPVFTAFSGMLFLGKLLNDIRFDVRWAVSGVIASVACLVFLCLYTSMLAMQSPDDYLLLDDRSFAPIVVMAATLFYMLKGACERVDAQSVFVRAVTYVSVCSLGIYLSHIWFRDVWASVFQQACTFMPDIPALLLYQLAVFAAGLVVTAVLRLVPGLKKLL